MTLPAMMNRLATAIARLEALAQLPNLANPTVNYAPDKTGKDDNFRGMTVFNNTLYVTKGSGSNGVNSVYQVGAKGALANGGVIDNATITILPGFNKLSEKVAETAPTTATPHPFGLQFLSDTVALVADEGDGVRMGVAGKVTSSAGLQLWKADATGNWSLAQTFQQGLVGQVTTPTGLGWKVQEDGLRNIAATQNANGTWTVYGTTSTVSDELTHDLGADPNEIVSITIDPNASTAANTAFTVLSAAAIGERFGGVAIAPVPEPESYVLALVSLGLLGAASRRQGRRS